MLKYITHKKGGEEWIETKLTGKELLQAPLLNKGTAFSLQERRELKLIGKLPHRVESLDEQVARAITQYSRYTTILQKYIYLNNLHDKNEVLFYKLLLVDLEEILPKIYTPGVGTAVKEFSSEFRQPRGLYISYPDRDFLEEILDNRTHAEIDLLVVTDGERILGIGDQGIGGMDIPIAKLVVYSLCGVNPYNTLPIMLDVGTDNPQLLKDPLYLGWRHPRLRGKEYDDFINLFVTAIQKKFPMSFLHWEDFGIQNARKILETYRTQHCSFNDDMQGTGVVTLAALLAAIHETKIPFENQRIVVFGAGTAGVGICDQLLNAMMRQGIKAQDAYRQFWLIDREGVLLKDSANIADFQKPYARPQSEGGLWPREKRDLHSVVSLVKPTILIGCSTVRNVFTETIIKEMAVHVTQPIIFPLSNPNENCEALPENLLAWTKGQALIATGSPFDPIEFEGKKIHITQCNNAYSFPGIGLGVIASKASQVTDNMLWAAALAISQYASKQEGPNKTLLPKVNQIPELACHVAIAVAKQAIEDKVARALPNMNFEDFIRENIWKPYYRTIKLAKR